MPSRKSSGVIDLRGGRSPKSAPKGQVPLFSPRTPEPPRKPLPLRARRRRVRALVALGCLVLLGAAFWGVSWLSYLPQYNISSISVAGAQRVTQELINRSVEAVLDDGSYHFLSRRNIFLFPRAEIESEIVKSFPPIKSAHITRPSLFSTSIVVTVEERQPFARWCEDAQGQCYFLDEGGFIYASVDDPTSASESSPSTSYVFSGGIASSTASTSSPQAGPVGQSFVRAHLPGLLSLLKFLGQAGFAPLGADVQGDQDFFVELREGFMLKVSYGADTTTLVKNLQLVLSSDVLQGKRGQLEYIDLRFGNRVYYRLKGQAEVST